MNQGQQSKTIQLGLTLLSLFIFLGCSQKPQQTASEAVALNDSSQGIIGGEVVSDQDPIASSTVGLVALKTGGVFCTGTLITGNTILTAAHCLDPRMGDIAVLFSNKVFTNQAEADQMVTEGRLGLVIDARIHALWTQVTPTKRANWGDIAVMKFRGKLPAGYAPAKILANTAALQNGMTVTLTGFGITDGIKKISTTTLQKTDVQIMDANFSEIEVMMDQGQNKGACHGDSGGPAFVNVNGKLALFGVTSRGANDPKDTCLVNSIYTNASTLLPWVRAAVADLNTPEALAEQNARLGASTQARR